MPGIAYDEAVGVVSQMPKQDVKAGESNKAEKVLNVALPSRDETAEVYAFRRKADPLSTTDCNDAASVHPSISHG